MSTDLVSVGIDEFTPVLYIRMRSSIEACHSMDECMKAQSVAAALVTYYKQARDQDSELKVREIRIRAWRQMSKLLASSIVGEKFETRQKTIAAVRERLGAAIPSELSDGKIGELLRLSEVPDDKFEELAFAAKGSISTMVGLGHPDVNIEREARARKAEEDDRTWIEHARRQEALRVAKAEDKRRADEAARRAAIDSLTKQVRDEGIVDAEKVGLTLDPKLAPHLVRFGIIMDRSMHEQLRQAAFDKKMTMWAIVREALNYWFVVNGYEKK